MLRQRPVQAAVSQRLDTPGADYQPGSLISISLGLRYETHTNWVPQSQLSLQHKSADQGALADRSDTAGTVAYLSPCMSATLANKVQAYAFVQQHAAQGLVVLGFSLDVPDQVGEVRVVAKILSFPVGLLGDPHVSGYGRIWHLPVSFVIDRHAVWLTTAGRTASRYGRPNDCNGS